MHYISQERLVANTGPFFLWLVELEIYLGTQLAYGGKIKKAFWNTPRKKGGVFFMLDIPPLSPLQGRISSFRPSFNLPRVMLGIVNGHARKQCSLASYDTKLWQ
jgi:hypothetical protein